MDSTVSIFQVEVLLLSGHTFSPIILSVNHTKTLESAVIFPLHLLNSVPMGWTEEHTGDPIQPHGLCVLSIDVSFCSYSQSMF